MLLSLSPSSRLAILACAFLLAPGVVLAAEGDAGRGTVTGRMSYYDHSDGSGDGNPFLDEDLTVIEPVIVVDTNVTDRLGLGVLLSYDYVSSASIDNLSRFSAQSGASGDNYIGGDVSVRYELDDLDTVGGHLSFSTEYDYTSIGGGASMSLGSEDRNRNIGLSLNGFFDTVDIIRFDGSEDEGSDDRITISGTATWYQVYTPTLHGEIGLTLGYQSGFLETPYNAVAIENPLLPPDDSVTNPDPDLDGTGRVIRFVPEEVPDTRIRGALFGRARKWLTPGTAVELGGRLYADDWGIYSLAVEPRLYQRLGTDWRLRPRYRFYVQSEADFFQENFFDEPEERSQDSDLASFTAHTVGLQLIWEVPLDTDLVVDLSADYVFRSDGLDQVFSGLGLTWSFDHFFGLGNP